MRSGLVVLVLAACSSPASARPTWPKPAAREIDGGESLAPRAAARAVTAVGEADRSSDKAAVDRPVAAAAASAGSSAAEGAPTTAAPTDTPPDEPLTGEEIVIEVED